MGQMGKDSLLRRRRQTVLSAEAESNLDGQPTVESVASNPLTLRLQLAEFARCLIREVDPVVCLGEGEFALSLSSICHEARMALIRLVGRWDDGCRLGGIIHCLPLLRFGGGDSAGSEAEGEPIEHDAEGLLAFGVTFLDRLE